MRRSWTILGLLGVLLLVTACEENNTYNTFNAGPTAPCSAIIVVNGRSVSVQGDAGSTVSGSGYTVTFGPDCSTTTVTTTTTAGTTEEGG